MRRKELTISCVESQLMEKFARRSSSDNGDLQKAIMATKRDNHKPNIMECFFCHKKAICKGNVQNIEGGRINMKDKGR